MKCAGKGFLGGGNSINKGIEASQGKGQLRQGKPLGRGLYHALCVTRALERWGKGGTILP